MPSRIPAFELAGHPSPAFPYPFVGYRRLPGVTAGQPAGGDLPGLARGIGNLLTQLHQADPTRIPPCPGGYENEPCLTGQVPHRPPMGRGGSSTTTSAQTTSSSTPPQAGSPA